MKNKSAIGVLGGMGPEASVYLYKKLIELSVNKFNAKHNNDFPEILLQSIPVPDFISDEKEKAEALRMLQERVIALNKLPLICLSIACNTAHLLLDDLQQVSQIPFVSMIEEVVSEVNKDGRKTIGILGTPSTLRSELYQSKLTQFGIASVSPDPRQYPLLENVIRNVIANTVTVDDKKALIQIADELHAKGAAGIILGCTELPLVFPLQYKIPVYNSVEILAMALLRRYY